MLKVGYKSMHVRIVPDRTGLQIDKTVIGLQYAIEEST